MILVVAGIDSTAALAASSSGASPATSGSGPAGSSSSGSNQAAPQKDGQPRATFGVGPATLGKVDQRGYFSYVMGLGGVYDDHAAVLNYASAPVKLSVFAADLGNAANGTIAIGLQTDRTKDAGGWITLPAKNMVVTVPGRTATAPGRVIIPFRIKVPPNATPGDHGAAIVAVLSTLGKDPKGENVRFDQRIGSRVYIRVNGPLHPALTIDGLKVRYHQSLNPLHGGSATVSYTVRNTGNVRLAARQSVSITGMFGARSKVITPADLQLLFPGAAQTITVQVPGVYPALLEKSRVTVIPELFSDQQQMPVSAATATVSFTAIPWTLLACLLVLILLVLLAWLVRRRAAGRPPRGGRHAGPNQPTGAPLSPTTRQKVSS